MGTDAATDDIVAEDEEIRAENGPHGDERANSDEEEERPSSPPAKDLKLPPKVDSEVLVLSDNVTKQIIKEGQGELPGKHATCFVHYRAWSVGKMHKFDDSWEEQQVLEILLGHEKKELRGLAVGIASMKAGERALLKVPWQMGYGKEGNFSFPNVPPMSDLIYEVELIGFETPREGVTRAQMTVEERIAAADRRKVDGNQYFKEEKLVDATQQYEMALAYLGDDFMFQLEGKYKDMADAVKMPCHLNLAACFLKVERYDDCIGQCTVVLVEDKHNVKALFRRGKARAALGRTDEASEDFQLVRKLAPDDKAAIRELRAIAAQEKQMYEKQKEFYKGIFKPPVAKPQPRSWITIFLSWLTSLLRPFTRLWRVKSD